MRVENHVRADTPATADALANTLLKHPLRCGSEFRPMHGRGGP